MISRIRMATRALLGRAGVESEMEKEMRVHLDFETEENIRRGMSPADARRAALVAFGGVEKSKEAMRDERSTRVLEDIWSDIRFAFRGMAKQPAFTGAVVTLLALGTGANTAIFSVVDEMILRPLPFADGDRMVTLTATMAGGQFTGTPSKALVDLWRSRSRSVEEVTTHQLYVGILGDTTRVPRREVEGAVITPGMLKFTGLRPILGRDILPADTVAEAPPVVLLGSALWKREFSGRKDIIGQTVQLDGLPYTVVGITPAGFFVPYLGTRPDVFVAMRSDPKVPALFAIAKLRPGVTVDEANRELKSLGAVAPPGLDFVSDPPRISDASTLTRASTKRVVFMLFGVVGFVLLIACANVANLMLSRAWARRREFAVRGAMGAGRSRLTRQLFTESLLLALAGGVAGFLVAIVLVKLLVRIQPDNIGMAGRIDGSVFGWAVAISILTGLLFGIAPALLIGDGRIGDVLKSSVRSATGGIASRRLRAGLVVAEVSLSVVLLVGAGLMVRTTVAMQRADIGMDPHGLGHISVRLSGKAFADTLVRRDAWTTILSRVRETPGIEEVAIALTGPPDFAAGMAPIEIEGRPLLPADSIKATEFNLASPDLFRVARMQFVAGRPFVRDHRFTDKAGGTELVINQRFARRFWPNGAIGRRMKRNGTWATIVGVVRDVDVPGVKGLPSGVQLYQSISLSPGRAGLVVRSRLAPALLEPLVKKAIKESGVQASVGELSMADSEIYVGRAMHRFTLKLIAGFAILALVLAGIGLHAVITYSVTQRVREIGIRIALGAQTSQVAGLVLRQGLALAVAGVIIGCAIGVAATRALRSMLYGVEPGDPLTMGVVALALLGVSIVASSLPARRAMRVDPADMVRVE